jgi:hypothetical protein
MSDSTRGVVFLVVVSSVFTVPVACSRSLGASDFNRSGGTNDKNEGATSKTTFKLPITWCVLLGYLSDERFISTKKGKGKDSSSGK